MQPRPQPETEATYIFFRPGDRVVHARLGVLGTAGLVQEALTMHMVTVAWDNGVTGTIGSLELRRAAAINEWKLYLGDNGVCLCGLHLGAAAKATGRDLSGAPLEMVDEVTHADGLVCCETCLAIDLAAQQRAARIASGECRR